MPDEGGVYFVLYIPEWTIIVQRVIDFVEGYGGIGLYTGCHEITFELFYQYLWEYYQTGIWE